MEMQTGAQRSGELFRYSRVKLPVGDQTLFPAVTPFSVYCGLTRHVTLADLISALLAVFLSLVQRCCSLPECRPAAPTGRFTLGVRPEGRPEPALSLCHPPCDCILTMMTYQ